MFKRFTKCPHFPHRIKHLAFLIATAGLVWSAYETGMIYGSKYWDINKFMLYSAIPFVIYFFLWKYNYFTRNK